MSTKDDVLRMIERMPEDVALEDIMYALYVRTKVDRGIDQIRRGETVSHEEVRRDIGEWLKSAGR